MLTELTCMQYKQYPNVTPPVVMAYGSEGDVDEDGDDESGVDGDGSGDYGDNGDDGNSGDDGNAFIITSFIIITFITIHLHHHRRWGVASIAYMSVQLT